ncbi:MAG: thioredoxin family protein [Deferrisomatales bacterium]|nr:thioredoxin family protein [Deferrisomatales bacterium]
MKIEVLGTGCPKCQKLYEAAKEAVSRTGADAQVSKVEDLGEIMKRGIMVTPALAVDGQIKSAGKVLKADDIAKFLG